MCLRVRHEICRLDFYTGNIFNVRSVTLKRYFNMSIRVCMQDFARFWIAFENHPKVFRHSARHFRFVSEKCLNISEMFWNCWNLPISLIKGNPVHLVLEARSFVHFASAREHTCAKWMRLEYVDISEYQYPWRYDSLKVDGSDVNFRWTLCHEFVSVAHKLGHDLFLEVVTSSN